MGVQEGTVIITVITKDGLTATKEFKIISVPASEPEVVPAYIPEPEPTPAPEPEEESEPIMVGPEMMQPYN